MKKILLLLSAATLLFSCKPDKVVPEATTGKLSVIFDNTANGKPVNIGSEIYTSYIGQPFEVKILRYFVSNFEFFREDGTSYVVPQDSSYFLINQEKAGSNICDFTVPNGKYTKVRFMLGVDSLRNTMPLDKRQGALDPTGDAATMYWDWNSGYIHLMMEGKSDATDTALSPNRKIIYHVGGFGGMTTTTINNTRWVEVDLKSGMAASINGASGAGIVMNVDIAKLFFGTNTIDFYTSPFIMTEKDAALLADNFSGMFSHSSTIVE